MLKRIILIRHAQSKEDINPNIKNKYKNETVPITKLGKRQVYELAEKIEPLISDYEDVKVFTSLTYRVLQTTQLFCSLFNSIRFEIQNERSIRNLNWGDTNKDNLKEIEQERYRAGVLFYKFPNGDNSSEFVQKIHLFAQKTLSEGKEPNYPECVIIFTHGFALRVIAKSLLNISDEDFRYLANPPNCYVSVMDIIKDEIILDKPLPRIKFEI